MNAVESERVDRAVATQAAEELWATFDDNEKACVRFGMLPAQKVQNERYEHIEGRLLAVALFGCAKHDGGMVA